MNFTLLLILAMVAWGVSWPIAKITTQNTPPEVLIFWRNLATTIAMCPLLYFYRDQMKISLKGFGNVFLGAILMSFYNYLFFLGLKAGLSGLGGVIVTTTNPLLNYGILILLGWHSVTKKEVLGLSLGLLGGILLLRIWEIDSDLLLKGGNTLFILASFFWAVLTIISSHSKKYLHPILFSFYVYSLSTLLTFPIAYGENFFSVLQNDISFWSGIFYLSVISTGFGTTVFFISSSKLGSGKASSYLFLVPGTAIFSSWIILNETPGITTILGGLMAIASVRIIQSNEDNKS